MSYRMSEKKSQIEKKQGALEEFEQILKRASEKRASDLHLKAGLPPIVRVNGNLYYLADGGSTHGLARLTNEQLLGFAYSMMNQRQRERYELGDEVDLGYEVPKVGRFRINFCQQR